MAACSPNGSILDGDPIDRIPVSRRLLPFPVSDAFIVKAKGKSMEPKIYEGDLIIARKTSEPQDGKVFVCVNAGECIVKRVRFFDENIWLESFNDVPTFKADKDFHVEGEVKSIISGRI
jgi:repressor LexA